MDTGGSIKAFQPAPFSHSGRVRLPWKTSGRLLREAHDMNRERALKVVLAIVGLALLASLYPLACALFDSQHSQISLGDQTGADPAG
jgi:hypothetical protein